MKQVLVMLGCLALILQSIQADVPRTLLFQGRLLDEASGRPTDAVQSRGMIFIISEVNGPDLYSHTADNVAIRNGYFQVQIPIPDTLLFDKPYNINMILQGAGGGQTGPMALKTVPYALTSQGTLALGGVSANLYSLAQHVHTTSGGKVFTVDGTSSALLPGDPQFTILDNTGSVLFRVNASGDIERVRQVSADSLIETSGSLVVRSAGQDRFVAQNSGAVTIGRNLFIQSGIDVGSVTISGVSSFSDLVLQKKLELGSQVVIVPNNDTGNVIGRSHGLEDHANSDLLSRLRSLTSGQVVTSGFHTHSFQASQITSTALAANSVINRHFLTSSLENVDVFSLAGIVDSKLATISSTGKITTAALPATLALLRQNNVFGAGFGASGSALLQTTNYFDQMIMSELEMQAPLVLGSSPMLEFTNANREFFWRISKEGRVSLAVAGGAVEAFAIEVTDNQTKFDFKAVDLVLLEGTLFGGNSIQNGSLSGTVLATQTLRSIDIANDSITAIKLASGSVTTEKLVLGAVTNEKLDGAPVRSRQILDGSITADKIATSAINGTRIRNQTLTNEKFADGQINGSKFSEAQLGTQEVRNGSLTDVVLENATGAGLGPITGLKFAAGSITDTELATAVIRERSSGFFIGTTATTVTTSLLSLSSPQASATLLRFNVPAAGGVQTPLIHLSNQIPDSYSASINLDSSLSMRSQQMARPVTVSPAVLATLFGAPDASGKCPMNNGWEYIASDLSAQDHKNPQKSGSGFCFKHVATTVTYKEAVNRCQTIEGINSAQLCTAMELRQACRKVNLNGQVSIVSDFAYTGGQIQKVAMTVNNGGNPVACTSLTPEYTLLDTAANPRAYSCCYKPR